jgi:hypothetical protein
MSRRIPASRLALVGALALAAGLSACGKVGRLERPAPMFGHKPAPAESEAPAGKNPNVPIETVDPRDRSIDVPPAANLPPPGATRPSQPESPE